MGVFDKILTNATKDVTQSIGQVIDQVVTNDSERLQAKNELTKIVTNSLTDLAKEQKEVLVTELNGNKLQRNWRPIVMLMFAFIVVYAKFIAPAFGLPNAELEPYFWNLLEIGLGGYVIGRTVEKVAGKVTQNIDLSFIKRKNRKL